jgi:hypothetical protein
MNKIKLYHYSNTDFKGYIKPKFFGLNNYTSVSKDLSGYKRIYFYADDKSKEYFFNGSKFLYIAEIKQNKVYDLKIDVLKCIGNFDSISEFISYIKSKGFSGFKDFNGRQDVICLFKAVKIKSRQTLTK